jgi:hypothetical protein
MHFHSSFMSLLFVTLRVVPYIRPIGDSIFPKNEAKSQAARYHTLKTRIKQFGCFYILGGKRLRCIFPVFHFMTNLLNCVEQQDNHYNQTKAPWPESASELCRPSHHRLSVKLMPTLADRGCHVVSVTDPYDRIHGFLDRSCYLFSQPAPKLYLRG